MSHTPHLSRREVLTRTAGLALSLPLLSACQSNADKKPLVTTGVLNLGPAKDFPAGTVSTQFLAQSGIVVANDSGTVLVIRPKCTHKGCMVPWIPEKNLFVCPCHGSRYNILGQVVHGPAIKSLPALTAHVNPDNTLSIDLDQLYHAS